MHNSEDLLGLSLGSQLVIFNFIVIGIGGVFIFLW